MKNKKRIKSIRVASVAMTSAAILITSGAVSSIASEDTLPKDSVCVTAKFESDPEINARKCYIAGEAISTGPSDDVGEDEAEDTVYAKINVGSESMTIWKSEVDHSNKNKELMAAGRADEMTVYPGDNWKIIQSNNEDFNLATEIYYLVDPEAELTADNVTRAGDYSVYTNQDDDGFEALVSVKNGAIHSYYDRPAQYTWRNGGGTALYYIDGVWARDDDKPNIILYRNGRVLSESHTIGEEPKHHRTKGPAYITYDTEGNIAYVGYRINGEIIKTREDWISKGGEAEGWDNYTQFERDDEH